MQTKLQTTEPGDRSKQDSGLQKINEVHFIRMAEDERGFLFGGGVLCVVLDFKM